MAAARGHPTRRAGGGRKPLRPAVSRRPRRAFRGAGRGGGPEHRRAHRAHCRWFGRGPRRGAVRARIGGEDGAAGHRCGPQARRRRGRARPVHHRVSPGCLRGAQARGPDGGLRAAGLPHRGAAVPGGRRLRPLPGRAPDDGGRPRDARVRHDLPGDSGGAGGVPHPGGCVAAQAGRAQHRGSAEPAAEGGRTDAYLAARRWHRLPRPGGRAGDEPADPRGRAG